LSCGKGKIFIAKADIKTDLQLKCDMCEKAQGDPPCGMMDCSFLLVERTRGLNLDKDQHCLSCSKFIGKTKKSVFVLQICKTDLPTKILIASNCFGEEAGYKNFKGLKYLYSTY
jgi:hypothetical protein